MQHETNADQRTYWREAAGRDWVALQADMDALLAPALDAVLDAAEITAGERILDIGCGTGALSRAAANKTGAGGHVTGLDISATMLGRAAEHAPRGGAAPVAWLEADAQTHAFEAGAFDCCISRFGVMFFADPVAAFSNLRRGARPGGRLAAITWRGPEDSPYFRLMGRVRAELAGPAPASDPHAPGPMAFADADRVVAMLNAAGWDAEARRVEVTLVPRGGIDGFVDQALRVGPLGAALKSGDLSERDVPAAQDRLREVFAPMTEPGGGLRIPNALNLFTARA